MSHIVTIKTKVRDAAAVEAACRRLDPAEQAVIRQIRAFREIGKKLSEITRELDRVHAPCRGTKWHSQMVKRILARAG